MKKYKHLPIKEQLKILDWSKDCKCSWQVNFYGLIVKGTNPECRAHDTRWQKLKTYLKQKVSFVRRNRS